MARRVADRVAVPVPAEYCKVATTVCDPAAIGAIDSTKPENVRLVDEIATTVEFRTVPVTVPERSRNVADVIDVPDNAGSM